MRCAPFSILCGPGGTGCDEVRFSVHGWDSRDVSLAAVCDCVKECMSFFNVIGRLVCWSVIVFAYLILFDGV